jgi:hypothetical protein
MQAVLMRLVALAALALTASLASAELNPLRLPGGVPGFPVSTVKIDPVLSSVLRSAGLDQPIQAVLTFDHYPPKRGAGYLNAYDAVRAAQGP